MTKVVDNGCQCITCVRDTNNKCILGDVDGHEYKEFLEFITGVVDTSHQFIAGVVATGSKFFAGVVDTGDKSVDTFICLPFPLKT